jgi:catechol 2,3-dioxygenase-like lactoylglutathione lyase family enzyme
MKVGYVVLYVADAESCQAFWTEKVGMIVKSRIQAGDVSVVKVGFADQDFAFELVPLSLMKDNPDGLDLATPSIAFHVADLAATRATLIANEVQVTEIGDHSGIASFGFADNENRWFAVING